MFVLVYNQFTVRKNDDGKYLKVYLDQMTPYKLTVPVINTAYNDMLNVEYHSYRVGADPIGFKGINGQLMLISIFDRHSNKYFKVYLCDVSRQRYFSLPDRLEGKEIVAYANKKDLLNHNYGTKSNPVPVFSFKGTDGKIAIESTDENSNLVMRSLEPTKAEYEHNVLAYLFYLMPKDVFNARFATINK